MEYSKWSGYAVYGKFSIAVLLLSVGAACFAMEKNYREPPKYTSHCRGSSAALEPPWHADDQRCANFIRDLGAWVAQIRAGQSTNSGVSAGIKQARQSVIGALSDIGIQQRTATPPATTDSLYRAYMDHVGNLNRLDRQFRAMDAELGSLTIKY